MPILHLCFVTPNGAQAPVSFVLYCRLYLPPVVLETSCPYFFFFINLSTLIARWSCIALLVW